MSHTPGPWKVFPRYSNGCECCPDIYTDEDKPRWIATAVGAPHVGFDDTNDNARLMAAAPMLLAALEAIRDYARDSRTGRMLTGEGYAMADAAIAKAKGGAQ